MQACTFSRTQVKAHLETRKHKHAHIQQTRSLQQRQRATVAGSAGDVERFSSPYPDPSPTQPPPLDLFRNARQIENTWLDEQGDEFHVPTVVTEDQNWASQCVRDFWRNIDAGRSNGTSLDNFWGSLLDNENDIDSSSRPDECDEGCEMPGLSVSGSRADGYAPYPSKTVCSHSPHDRREQLTSAWHRCTFWTSLIVCCGCDCLERL